MPVVSASDHAAAAAPSAPRRKPRLAAIEYIRGISMMGVIGIHVGSQYLMNTAANINLVALFEVATRFSVPIFFFISAFGLFYNLDMDRPFDFRHFLVRRAKTVLIPYIVWSAFYLAHDGLFYGVGFPDLPHFLVLLFFGNAKYQLYFLVILLWFYLFMPLWIYMVRRIGLRGLAILLLLQIAFDYWSSFSTSFNLYVYGLPDGSLLKPFLMYRLNYWVVHYIFIFVIGGWLAVHIEEFQRFMRTRRRLIVVAFWLSLAALLGYYYSLFPRGYTAMDAINTAHQLCPAGVIYTLTASLFFFTIFTYNSYPDWLRYLLHELGRHSYFAYLVHPVAITYLATGLAASGHIMTAPIAIGFYCLTLLLAMLSAIVCRQLGNHIHLLNMLTIGVYPKKKQ